MSVLKLTVVSGRPNSYLISNFETAGGKHGIAQRVIDYLNSLHTGTELAAGVGAPPSIAIAVQGSEVAASGTVTFSAPATAGDTVLVNGVTFTAAAVPVANEFLPGVSATTSAANLASAINASVTALVSGYVTASSALGVMTVRSAFSGLTGNQVTLAKGVDAGPVMTVSGARLTGGAADAAAVTLNF